MSERVCIQIDTGNAAFEDEPASEIARILRALADRFDEGFIDQSGGLHDVNGNRCGTVLVDAPNRVEIAELEG